MIYRLFVPRYQYVHIKWEIAFFHIRAERKNSNVIRINCHKENEN